MAGEIARSQMLHAAESGLAESVTYHPAAGGSRAIRAMVTRSSAEGPGGQPASTIEVCVLNDAADGIAATELDLAVDRVAVPRRPGETAAARHATRIVDERTDADFLTIEVR